jgi:probable phosphoglycerate mutase
VSDGPRVIRQWRFQPPPGATEILLVRHGESEPAVVGTSFELLDGQSNPALSPEGEEEAEQVCERLASENVGAIYVSTLRRTTQTAAPLAQRLGLEPVVDADLREVFLGELEGGGAFRQKMTTAIRWPYASSPNSAGTSCRAPSQTIRSRGGCGE